MLPWEVRLHGVLAGGRSVNVTHSPKCQEVNSYCKIAVKDFTLHLASYGVEILELFSSESGK